MYGQDTMFGSYFDKYYLDYNGYIPQALDDSIFNVPINDTCGSFPGPGVDSNRIHFNPMR